MSAVRCDIYIFFEQVISYFGLEIHFIAFSFYISGPSYNKSGHLCTCI